MRIGLLGGSFDPIHKGHLALAKAALLQLRLDRVYFVLAPLSPFKTKQKLSAVGDRLSCLHLALASKSKFFVGRWELKKKKPAYTIDTLRVLRNAFLKDSLFLIMGSDAWAGFWRWKSPRQILSIANVIVGRRPGQRRIAIPHTFTEQVHLLKGIFPDVSATQLRSQLKKGKSVRNLPSGVLRYINQRKLYR